MTRNFGRTRSYQGLAHAPLAPPLRRYVADNAGVKRNLVLGENLAGPSGARPERVVGSRTGAVPRGLPLASVDALKGELAEAILGLTSPPAVISRAFLGRSLALLGGSPSGRSGT